ncbi:MULTISPECIES: glycosyltransferase family 9 protein [Thermodesulfovibrio]|uniref:glycosyltransferase family 9 protein n=1 Tax=Thermodesulfovibrio yellowstonii TaxID=28262 RepID=UPI0004003C9E|nr:glycosyltransferase family 9 protein [Thermodesulfovibrio islandicus]
MNFKKILFIRRDNIGDLVCTTPAIHAVRQAYPQAKIGILVNSYNAEAIRNNPDIDEIYIYEKAKHVPEKNKFSVWCNNLKVLSKIRKENYDVAIACGSYSEHIERLTFFTGARVKIGYCPQNKKISLYTHPIIQYSQNIHEVIKTFNLLKPLNITEMPGDLIIYPDKMEQKKFEFFKINNFKDINKPFIAISISARIKKNRWTKEKFIKLIEKLLTQNIYNILILWAPGSSKHPMFPGDDEFAESIIQYFDGKVKGYYTPKLNALIAAISISDIVVTLDTGSLHIASALKKPVVALMTKAKSYCWYPWNTKNIVITADESVENIDVETVYQAVQKLLIEKIN